MERVIITSADGFVGRNTVEYFLQQRVEVLAIDTPQVTRSLKENKSLSYLSCDIANMAYILENVMKDNYDIFVNFAWAGSAYMYSLDKSTAHGLCKSLAKELDIELVWPIITNAYGVGEYSHRFVNSTLRKNINIEPFLFTATTQNYDLVYINDVEKAFYLISKNGKPFCKYIIGSGNAKPLKGFILEMVKGCDAKQEPIFSDIPFTGVNLPLNVYDTTVTKKDTGFEASIPFGEGAKLKMGWISDKEQVFFVINLKSAGYAM